MPTETEPWGPFDSDIRLHTGSVHGTPHCSPQSSAPGATETELQQLKKPTEVKREENFYSWVPDVFINLPFHEGLFKKPTEAEEKWRSFISDHLKLQKPEESRSRGCGDSSHPSFRHQPLSRKHAPSDMAATRRHSAGSFFHMACTVTLWLLTLSAGMGAEVGNPCGEEGGSVAARERKVILQCPLTADVSQTKQSVMIKLFSNSSHGAEEVLGCDWLSRQGKFDCPPSLFQAQLIAIHNDSVLASLPKHRLQKGAYRCQLVPYDRDQPFTDCTSTEQEETTTESQVTPSTAVHHDTDEKKNSDLSNGPQEKSFACSADDRRGLVAAVVVLTITVFCQLMAMAAMVIYHLRYRRHRYPRYKESPQDTLDAFMCTQSTSPLPVPSPDEKEGGLLHCSPSVHHVSCHKSI